jgi:hypothetical protein
VAQLIRYAPPIELKDVDRLSGVSKEYPLRDQDPHDPPLRSKHGSIESRMKVTGGNLRLLFPNRSLKQLRIGWILGVKKIDFTEIPPLYFAGMTSGVQKVLHHVAVELTYTDMCTINRVPK